MCHIPASPHPVSNRRCASRSRCRSRQHAAFLHRIITIHGLLVLLLLMAAASPASAGLLDTITRAVLPGDRASDGTLSNSEVVQGLKEALRTTTEKAVSRLGTKGGFLNTPSVRIPVPESLATAEQLARTLGQGKLADAFITSMNSAAEEATRETLSVFTQAIGKMTFADARGILNGPKNAATSYFQRTSTDALTTRIRPIVEKATSAAQVTESYKKFASKLSLLSPLTHTAAPDLDTYVTNKTVDGIFTIMAQEEAAIRADPAARTTDLLRKVFGNAK